MTLAELIQERGDIQKRIEQLKVRLNNNALKQEKYSTPENPTQLLKELETLYARLEQLIISINQTNNNYGFVELLARRDVLLNKISAYRNFVDAASGAINRFTKTEIAILPNVNVEVLRKHLDTLSQEYRTLENMIQAKNWSTVVK